MKRRAIIIAYASILALLAASLPLVAIAIYAHHSAAQNEKRHLLTYAERVLKHTHRSLGLARNAIRTLEREHLSGCTADQINRMRHLTMATRAVKEIGYFINRQLTCTGWGKVDQPVQMGRPDLQLGDGYGLFIRAPAKLSDGLAMNMLSHGDYNALIHPERMIDVSTDTAMSFGVTSLSGHIIATSASLPPDLLRFVATHTGSGRHGQFMYASTDDGILRAFAVSHYTVAEQRIDDGLWYLIPLGLIASVLLVGLVLWTSRHRLSPEKELAVAIRNREFIMLYQPIIDLSTGLCVGAEALTRWERPHDTPVTPEVFIPLAEKTGLIEPLTDFVIERVVADLGAWLGAHADAHIAINISSRDIQSGRFLPILEKNLSEYNINPSQIWLEITERSFIDVNAARMTIELARSHGHYVSIDDFGTGYSSLSLLETLPIDALKIDKSFIDAIGKRAVTSSVVSHIINLAHSINCKIIAEGVETQLQESYLHQAGVGCAQGWLYSKALSAAEFSNFHRQYSGVHGGNRNVISIAGSQDARNPA